MKDFKHLSATSFDAAVALLANGKSEVIAGGTDLIYSMKGMHTPNLPDTVIDIKNIPDSAYVKEEGGYLKIGALTTLADIANNNTVRGKYTVLAEAAELVASTELRNVGTIGGNICQKPRCIYYRNEFNEFPCIRKGGATCYALTGVNKYHSIFGMMGSCLAVCPSDIAPALVALGAKIVTTKKTWEASDFFGLDQRRFNGEKINWLADDEIVKEIQILTAMYRSTYKKWSFRKAIDFPMVSAAVVIKDSKATVALGGVYNTPRLFIDISISNATAAGEACVKGAVNTFDSAYKIQIAKTMVKRAIEELA